MSALVLRWRKIERLSVGWIPAPASPVMPAAIVGPPGSGISAAVFDALVERVAALEAAGQPGFVALPAYASIATFGDSIAVGVGASTAANRWANLIAGHVGGTLLNAGVSGTVLQNSSDGTGPRADNGRDRFATAVLGANKRAAIFLAHGFNDARATIAPATMNVTNYQADLREVVSGLIIGGYARDTIYIGTPYYITDAGLLTGSAGFAGQTRSGFEAHVAAALAVAAEFGTRSCDLYAFLRDNGFAATTAGDNIHPNDAGHSLIASGWTTRTRDANTRASPASVSASASGSSVTVTATPVTGALSYEYALIANSVDIAANATGAFSDVATGTYWSRARAVFGDGGKGPWTFSSAGVAVVPSSGVFAQDSFTDAAGTDLTAHAPESGGGWSLYDNVGVTSTSPKINAAGRLYNQGTTSTARFGTPPSANYYVEAVIDFVSAVASETVGITARDSGNTTTLDCYIFRWSGGNWQLFKTVDGTTTQLGSNVPDALTSGSRTIRLTVNGSTISGSVGGSVVVSVTDTDITAAGKAGIRNTTAQTATTGRQLASIVAST